MPDARLQPLTARPCGPLKGAFTPPGDKSISHRALILGALCVGETRISGLLEAGDVLRTASAMEALGAAVRRAAGSEWSVHGCGVGGFRAPDRVLDFGNSGTGARLTLGAAATTGLRAVFAGDASLSRRPMGRVIEPLARMGACFTAADGGRLPVTLDGADGGLPIVYRLPVPSAQVKSAVLLAALNTPGRTTVIEPVRTRDHTERMLAAFGAAIESHEDADGRHIAVSGEAELTPRPVAVPGDPSSAAFALVAASIMPGSRVTARGVLMNPLRTGLFETLREMGADIAVGASADSGGEAAADVTAQHAELRGIDVPPERAPAMIDEYPALAVAAAFAQGRTVMRGLAELRLKESDRLAAMARGLAACGVEVEELPDGLVVHGRSGDVPGGATVETFHDHRIAMAFLTLGCAARAPVSVDDAAMIATSYPGFAAGMRALGADLAEAAP